MLISLIVLFTISLYFAFSKKKAVKYISILLVLASLFGIYAQQTNLFSQPTTVKSIKQVQKKNDKVSKKDIAIIKKLVMTNHSEGFEKQGFIAIPQLNILLPIYNDAYSKAGLDLGADTANNKQGGQLGVNNYAIAAHSFNDAKTGFSALQQYRNNNEPYIKDGKNSSNDWLNGVKIFVANQKGIYEFKITDQILVDQDNTSVLDAGETPRLTLISCLFPDTEKRIITQAEFVSFNKWSKANKTEISYFDLRKQPTNARADWFNSGNEEGSNGYGAQAK